MLNNISHYTRIYTNLKIIVLIVAYSPVLADSSIINITMPSSPPASAIQNIVYDDFLGISFELSSFDTLCEYTQTDFKYI